MKAPETVAIIDFGSQYVQLIARRVREQHVHSLIVAHTVTSDELREMNAVGIILSGGPASVYMEGAPQCDPALFDLGLPVLGICYGMQLVCKLLGGKVESSPSREYGRATLTIESDEPLLSTVPPQSTAWMSHGDLVTGLSDAFVSIGRTDASPFAAVRHRSKPVYGVQFHPEVTHTPCGRQILRNFLYEICGCTGDWNVGHIVELLKARVKAQVEGRGRVICALSGGVDSSVTATLLHQAIGDQLTCIFVDNGLLRTGEVALVDSTFRGHFHMDLRVVDASTQFLDSLSGVTDPQEKRRIIGHEFIKVFDAESHKIAGAHFLAQGTLYPDVIESGHSATGQAANIKLHHNVGGLPEKLGFELVEPLRELFKDEVRLAGEHLGLPRDIVWRHPFPGPGLAVRIVGEITPHRLAVLREADAIAMEEIRAAGWYDKISQALVALIPVSTVGVTGDDRSYEGTHVAALRCVESADFMTADWVHVDYDLLGRIATRIMNEVAGINRVVYDISSKPPATIEWE